MDAMNTGQNVRVVRWTDGEWSKQPGIDFEIRMEDFLVVTLIPETSQTITHSLED